MRHYVLALLLFSFAGCIKVPTDEANCKMLPPPCLEKTVGEALASSDFFEGDFPNCYWWEMFSDPQLNTLIYTALSDSPTIDKVAAKVQAAEAEANIKKSYLLPTLSLTGSANYQYLGKYNLFRAYAPTIFPAKVNEYQLDLNFSYEIDFWGKNRNIYRAALGIAKAEIAEQQSAILMLTTAVASAYFQLQAELEQFELLKREKEIFSRLFELSKLRQAEALDDISQTLVSEDNLLQINKNLEQSMQQVAIARHTLNMLIGEGPELCEEVERITLNTAIKFPLPCNISSELIARRADLMAQVWRIEAAAHLVGAAKADFYPSIDLFAILGLDSVFFNKFFTMGSRYRSVKPAIYLPIFTGGRLRANLREKQAEFDEMIYTYNESVLRAVKEVADQIVVFKTVNSTLQLEESLLENKIKNQKIADELYKNAVGNILSPLTLETQVIQEQLEKSKLQFQQRSSVIQLIKALGGGYCTSEVPLG